MYRTPQPAQTTTQPPKPWELAACIYCASDLIGRGTFTFKLIEPGVCDLCGHKGGTRYRYRTINHLPVLLWKLGAAFAEAGITTPATTTRAALLLLAGVSEPSEYDLETVEDLFFEGLDCGLYSR